MRLLRNRLAGAALIVGALTSAHAQQTDTSRAPTAAFVGRMISNLDSMPVRSADIRLVFVDSVRQVRGRNGADPLEVFADSTRTRVAVTDSTGAFAIRRLPAGRYLLHVRRIGYEQLQGALVVDTGTIRATLALQVISRVLAKVVVTETSIDKVKERLNRDGFVDRSHLGISGTFVQRADILRLQRQTVGDLLAVYGVHDGDIMLDRMPFDYESVRDYPAELVIGVEIYRHSRPTEFNGTRRGPGALSPGGQAASMQPLVLIWTYIP
jgi:hypothetical protein